jgi:hypothetical protein
MTAVETINAFKRSKWYKPTLRRYNAHLKACDELDCPELKESFLRFIDEIENAPTDECRADMLAIEELAPYTAFQQYPAYVTPIMAEQKLDFYSAAMSTKMGARIAQRRTIGYHSNAKP